MGEHHREGRDAHLCVLGSGGATTTPTRVRDKWRGYSGCRFAVEWIRQKGVIRKYWGFDLFEFWVWDLEVVCKSRG